MTVEHRWYRAGRVHQAMRLRVAASSSTATGLSAATPSAPNARASGKSSCGPPTELFSTRRALSCVESTIWRMKHPGLGTIGGVDGDCGNRPVWLREAALISRNRWCSPARAASSSAARRRRCRAAAGSGTRARGFGGGRHHRQPDVRAVPGPAERRSARAGRHGARLLSEQQDVGDDAGRTDGVERVLRSQAIARCIWPIRCRARARALTRRRSTPSRRARCRRASFRTSSRPAIRSRGRCSASARRSTRRFRTASSRSRRSTSSTSR